MTSFAEDFQQFTGSAAPSGLSPQLKSYWGKPVSELCTLAEPDPTAEAQERHRIYALMVMALVHEYWNGNKKGRSKLFTYPWNDFDPADPGRHLDDDYLGHNIAAIAVNGDGRIIDFDFNHNRLFNSSAEHAEARLVRRVFALAQLSDTWRPTATGVPLDHEPLTDYTMLEDVTIYTSLESCAQCAGVMALGRVRQIVYLQTDPGMYFIGRILRNLTDEKLRAPLPISGQQIGLPYFSDLDHSFGVFAREVSAKPFWSELDANGAVRRSDTDGSVTSFLCTSNARAIYRAARTQFDELTDDVQQLRFPTHQPAGVDGKVRQSALTNAEVVAEAADFLGYAVDCGRRATPHR